MKNNTNRNKKRSFQHQENAKRIYAVHNYFREKILLRFPILYSELIKDNYPGTDRTEFILDAVEEKFQRDGINFIPKEKSKQWTGSIEDMPLEL